MGVIKKNLKHFSQQKKGVLGRMRYRSPKDIQTSVDFFEVLLDATKVFSPLSPTDVQLVLGLEIVQATVRFQYYIFLEKFG